MAEQHPRLHTYSSIRQLLLVTVAAARELLEPELRTLAFNFSDKMFTERNSGLLANCV
jgi:hypothetical protein